MNNLFKTSNPAFNGRAFSDAVSISGSTYMTLSGTINKTTLSIVLTILGGIYSWYTPNAVSLMLPTGIIGFIIALITIFRPHISPYTVPLYAVVEGIFLGALSLMIESKVGTRVNEYGQLVETSFRGIASQAVALTFGVFFVMLFLYRYKVIKVTQKLRSIIISSTLAVATVYFIFWIASFFGAQPFIYGNSLMSIGFSLFVIVIASMNLLVDFDTIEKGVENNAPKYMEWYCAFGILVTLIWLYIEILRLLSKIQSRN